MGNGGEGMLRIVQDGKRARMDMDQPAGMMAVNARRQCVETAGHTTTTADVWRSAGRWCKSAAGIRMGNGAAVSKRKRESTCSARSSGPAVNVPVDGLRLLQILVVGFHLWRVPLSAK